MLCILLNDKSNFFNFGEYKSFNDSTSSILLLFKYNSSKFSNFTPVNNSNSTVPIFLLFNFIIFSFPSNFIFNLTFR